MSIIFKQDATTLQSLTSETLKHNVALYASNKFFWNKVDIKMFKVAFKTEK